MVGQNRTRVGGRKKRILFLADRNILVDQTKTNDFKPFPHRGSESSTALTQRLARTIGEAAASRRTPSTTSPHGVSAGTGTPTSWLTRAFPKLPGRKLPALSQIPSTKTWK